MSMRFTKMHGIGNDFVVVDWRDDVKLPPAERIAALADRHTGIGFDQLLSVEPARDPSCDWYYGVWNADGSPSGQCGNGVRCVAAWLYREGVIARDTDVRLESPSGPVTVRVLAADRVTVDMGEPDFTPSHLPFDAPQEASSYMLDVDGTPVTIGAVSMGNPHAVLEVPDLGDPHLENLGPVVTGHARFADGVNTGFALRVDRKTIRLRVHERGSGWTRACGTGACAAAAVLQRRGLVDAVVDVSLPGGTLTIEWHGPGHTLWMTGPAAFVFEGEI
ncbi:diaminopimelate epimerase [Luteibacter rhizovicinus]|nr:diaminopimelate epimerase [Luteibacter rhizovicinus]